MLGAITCGVGGGLLAFPGVAAGVAGGVGAAAAGVAAVVFMQNTHLRRRMAVWDQMFEDADIPGVRVVRLEHLGEGGLRLLLDLPPRWPYREVVDRLDKIEVAADLDRFTLAAEREGDARMMWLRFYRKSSANPQQPPRGGR